MTSQTLDPTLVKKERLQESITERYRNWKKLRTFNRNCDAALTLTTIILTLVITIIGTEGIQLSDNQRKITTGICGAIVVALNSIGNAFPVKQRAGGYRTLESQALTLNTKLEYLVEPKEIEKELPNIKAQLTDLIMKSVELEE